MGDVEPAGQAKPAVHGPLQLALLEGPVPLPYRPAAHCPEHAAEVKAGDEPYSPAAHGVQVPAPRMLYRPTGHTMAVDEVDPGPQAKPASQTPLQLALVRPDVLPNRPAAQLLQVDAPPRLYAPGGHRPLHRAADSLPTPRAAP